jgi:Tfp pilus assembly protein PilN
VRAVNLLPADVRVESPRTGGGPAHVLLGALAALVVLASLWAVASKQAGDRRAALDRVDAQAAAAEARAGASQPYEEFARLAKARLETVSALARSRFDWAHAMREISRVLPADVWLTQLGGDSGAGGGTPSATTSAAPSPTFKLDGCTRSQARVAQLMVRLRAVDGVRDVELSKSQKPDGAGDESCPANRSSDPRFTIAISFAGPNAPKAALDATGQVAAPAATAPSAGGGAPAPAAKSGSTSTSAPNAASDLR